MLSYAQLMERTDAPAGSAWGLHGLDDEIGTLNFLTPECAVEAAKLVVTGKTYNLDRSLTDFNLPHRPKMVHVVHGDERHYTRDDHVDSFFPQAGTQVDGLRHFRHPVHGFYNFAPMEEIGANTPKLGVQHYAEKAIVGRAVLLDVGRYRESKGAPLDLTTGDPITIDLLEEVAKAQNVEFKFGDILLLRTGWLGGYFGGFDADHMERLSKRVTAPGLAQSHKMLAWLWDHRFSIVAADNPGVEAVPPVPTSDVGGGVAGVADFPAMMKDMMHPILIPLLGVCLGELWDLDALAKDCADDGRYAFMVTVKPLNLVGGVGSPANAIAIK